MTLEELAKLLPEAGSLSSADLIDGVEIIDEPLDAFVEPDLSQESSFGGRPPSVIVVSAPAAVGKSTLARELAYRKNALLWDLSHFNVGDSTFGGTLLKIFGVDGLGEIMAGIADGDYLILLDALDETKIRSGSQNFDAFIEDIAGNLEGERSAPVIVLFARTETAEWVKLMFDDLSVPVAHYQIEFFDHDRASEFIDKRLDARRERDGEGRVHRQSREPFVESRERVFDFVHALLGAEDEWSGSRVRRYLGYAPVLEAITDFLDVGNPTTKIQEIDALQEEFRETTTAESSHWEFLVEIIDDLLERERGRVVEGMKEALDTEAKKEDWEDWGALYSDNEQCARVLDFKYSSTNARRFAPDLPARVAEGYEDVLARDIREHPFLGEHEGFANIVFQEYLYAWALTRQDVDRSAVRKELQRGDFLPSPLLGRFVLLLDGEGHERVDGRDVGIIYESLVSEVTGREQSSVVVRSVEEETDLGVVSFSSDIADEGPSEEAVIYVGTENGITFWRRLSQADIVVDCPVRLGLSGGDFRLGPAVRIECEQFGTRCSDLEVVLDGETDIEVRAEGYETGEQVPEIHEYPRGQGGAELIVDWPNVSWPWSPYEGTIEQDEIETSAMRKEALLKLLRMFRGQRGRRDQTVYQSRWSPEEVNSGLRDELIELALEWGVLRREDIFFVFDSDFDPLKKFEREGIEALSGKELAFVEEFLGL